MMMMVSLEKPEQSVAAPILVVDDDEGILDLVVLSLELQGFATKAARDGTEALAIVERDRPGLVLLDMRMPGMDGWDFARALDERGIEIPIVVMTAARDARRWAEEIQADDYLEKPFDIHKLVETVRKVLG